MRKRRRVSTLLAILLLLLSLPLQAAEPARVLLFGTFHFQDAGLDVVKQQDVDVMTAEAQAYLQGLSERLAGFRMAMERHGLPIEDRFIKIGHFRQETGITARVCGVTARSSAS